MPDEPMIKVDSGLDFIEEPKRVPASQSEPPPARASQAAIVPETPAPAPAPSKPRASTPLAGGYPQALVLIVATVCATVLAGLGQLDSGVLVALYVIILGAAGATALGARGHPPSGGAAALVLVGLSGLGALGAELLGRWRG